MEITEDKKKFWIVIRNTDQRYFKHFTKENAETEAKRLAKKEKGKFFVLESYLKVDDRIGIWTIGSKERWKRKIE